MTSNCASGTNVAIGTKRKKAFLGYNQSLETPRTKTLRPCWFQRTLICYVLPTWRWWRNCNRTTVDVIPPVSRKPNFTAESIAVKHVLKYLPCAQFPCIWEICEFHFTTCHHHSSSNQYLLNRPKKITKKTLGHSTFAVATSKLWNSLPVMFRNIDSLYLGVLFKGTSF